MSLIDTIKFLRISRGLEEDMTLAEACEEFNTNLRDAMERLEQAGVPAKSECDIMTPRQLEVFSSKLLSDFREMAESHESHHQHHGYNSYDPSMFLQFMHHLGCLFFQIFVHISLLYKKMYYACRLFTSFITTIITTTNYFVCYCHYNSLRLQGQQQLRFVFRSFLLI